MTAPEAVPASAVLLQPAKLTADDDGIVPTMVRAAAAAKITVQPLSPDLCT